MTLLTAHRILIGTATACFAFYAGWEFTGGGGAGAGGGIVRGALAAAAALGLGFYFRTLKPAATSGRPGAKGDDDGQVV